MPHIIVKFLQDWTVYAAGDEAAFVETLAGWMVSKGIASRVGPVPPPPPKPVAQPAVAEAAAPAPAAPELPLPNVSLADEGVRKRNK